VGRYEGARQGEQTPFRFLSVLELTEVKLLHLHPLTLEDILQQEPREKLELFPKLGYYFIIFRAVESLSAPAQFDVVCQKAGSSQLSVHGGVIEFNIYLVVFRHGICTVSCSHTYTYIQLLLTAQ
jgi:magnesium transporter